MKNLVILGAGTGGTMIANRMRRRLSKDWAVTTIDPADTHLYQPGLLFLPFGGRNGARIERARARTLRHDVRWIKDTVTTVEPDAKRVVLERGGGLKYDLLAIASGAQLRPQETPGLLGSEWRKSVHEFYTLEGALALREALADFRGGRVVVNVVENPIKCPVAPLEFLFLADASFVKRGMRDRVELVYATPLDGAFTRPVASAALASMLQRKGISVVTEFGASEVNSAERKLMSYDGREIAYDLLVTIPLHFGAPFVEASGLGNESAFVPTHPGTLAAKGHDDIFALGDATDLPSSKAGSVAHFQSEILGDNIVRASQNRSLEEGFDGHSNCFIESGFGKALLIDFNYETEPLRGTFPLPFVGPFSLLKETRLNHLGKLAFRWAYWNALLPARPLPISTRMSMRGKRRVDTTRRGEHHAHA